MIFKIISLFSLITTIFQNFDNNITNNYNSLDIKNFEKPYLSFSYLYSPLYNYRSKDYNFKTDLYKTSLSTYIPIKYGGVVFNQNSENFDIKQNIYNRNYKLNYKHSIYRGELGYLFKLKKFNIIFSLPFYKSPPSIYINYNSKYYILNFNFYQSKFDIKSFNNFNKDILYPFLNSKKSFINFNNIFKYKNFIKLKFNYNFITNSLSPTYRDRFSFEYQENITKKGVVLESFYKNFGFKIGYNNIDIDLKGKGDLETLSYIMFKMDKLKIKIINFKLQYGLKDNIFIQYRKMLSNGVKIEGYVDSYLFQNEFSSIFTDKLRFQNSLNFKTSFFTTGGELSFKNIFIKFLINFINIKSDLNILTKYIPPFSTGSDIDNYNFEHDQFYIAPKVEFKNIIFPFEFIISLSQIIPLKDISNQNGSSNSKNKISGGTFLFFRTKISY